MSCALSPSLSLLLPRSLATYHLDNLYVGQIVEAFCNARVVNLGPSLLQAGCTWQLRDGKGKDRDFQLSGEIDNDDLRTYYWEDRPREGQIHRKDFGAHSQWQQPGDGDSSIQNTGCVVVRLDDLSQSSDFGMGVAKIHIGRGQFKSC